MQVVSHRANKVGVVVQAIIIYCIIILGLGLHKVYCNAAFVPPDVSTYSNAAKDLFLQHRLNDIRPIGISAIVGLPLIVDAHFTNFAQWTWFVNFCCWIGTLLLFYDCVYKLCNARYAKIASLVLASHISLVVYSTLGLSETCFVFILMCIAKQVLLYCINRQPIYLQWLCVFLLISISIRPTMLYFSVLLFLVILFYSLYQKKYVVVGTTLLCIVYVHLYQLQMQAQFGRYTFSFIGNTTVMYYLNNRAKQLQNNSNFTTETNAINQQIKNLTIAQKDQFAVADIKQQLQHNCGNVIVAATWNLLENSSKGNPLLTQPLVESTIFYSVFYKLCLFVTQIQNILFSIITLIALPFIRYKCKSKLPKHIYNYAQFVCLLCLYVMGISAISFYQHDRFHVVFAPLLLLLITSIIYYWRPTNVATR
jgi:hypothetical protein